ncbi:hypothetical protein C8A03DRAFT_48423 [Achaetomium macrosporum]|uniref:Uncharacterized protein n=1 Tax=Achaetomium macrosporum TaxID=79813 RepID=A0AAN7H6C1_9PEZI|nr:hypothetical protein C8A03DRAFT_48423 [Achaetomium macrosporum]
MWLSTLNAGSVPGRLNMPKRARHDPNDFFWAQKRVQCRDSLDLIGQWLDAESFGGLDIDCPPDTLTELKNAGVAPSPTTRKRVRQQIEAGTTDQDNEAEDEHEGDDDQQLKELFSRLLSRMQRSDQQVPAEDNGFSEPDEQQDEEGHTSQSDGRHVHVTSAFSYLAGIELEDTTTVLDSHPKPFDLSPFELAFALWEKKHNISRAAHSHLREVLQLLCIGYIESYHGGRFGKQY